MISNLIVDQTVTNPAAVKAAKKPHRTFLGEPVEPCTEPACPRAAPRPAETLFMPNVTTDVGLSPPYNSWFTLFGQFFDHGLDSTVKGGSGTVFVPLKADDPLIAGPDHELGSADDLPPQQRFMVLTRAENQPGPDGILGTADDVQDATNTDSPWVDQSQTYSSHSSHQVFLRDYELNASRRSRRHGQDDRGRDGGMATLGRRSRPRPPMSSGSSSSTPTCSTSRCWPPTSTAASCAARRGMPQIVTASGLVEGNLAAPWRRRPTPGASTRVPGRHRPQRGARSAQPDRRPLPAGHRHADADTIRPARRGTAAGTYDDEMLDAHFIAR